MPSDAHRAKRQYQPSNQTTLNSFFARTTNAQSPVLDDATQSSLLSVGMRVRKAVPEGYKTHKTLVGSAGFPFPSSAPSLARATPTAPTTLRLSTSTMNSRELAPFCGLHKIGGIGAPTSSAPATLQNDYDEDVPELYMSQSTTSTYSGSCSQPANTKKRGYEDEVEEDMDLLFQEEEKDAIGGEQPDDMRPIARMKSSSSSRKSGAGQIHIFGHDDDFEDASFLVPMEVED